MSKQINLNTYYYKKSDIHDFLENKANLVHVHGKISNDGKVGTDANKPLITGTNGVIQASSFGKTANTFCEGNDPRLSDARTPKFTDIGASSTSPKDLDNYTTGGFYYCDMGTEAQYITNCPKTGTNNTAFFLLVETWNSNTYSVKQTLTYYNNQKTYVRTKVNTNWSPWYLIQTTNNYIASTHTSSTSAWTGTSDEICKVTKGTVIYYYLAKEPTTSPVTLNLTLANGDTTGVKNVYFSNGMRLSNQYASNSMICLYYSGSDWFVVNPYKYKGVTLASSGTNTTKPYYRLFHIESGNGASRSSRLIFEISSKTSVAYAKFAVYMRQNTSTSASTISFQCLEKTEFDLNTISVGFRNNYPNTSCDIYINVNGMVHYIIKVIDDQLREGTYTQYSPTEGNVEAYTSVANAGTQLYGSAYTNIINPQWNIVATTIKKAGGTSSQFLKADGSVSTVVNDLTTGGIGNALSAEQGKTLKSLVDDKITNGTGTVTSTNIADNAVMNAKIGNSQVNNAKLSNNAISTSKIQNKAVTNDKIDPVVFWGGGSGTTAGYIKMIKFKFTSDAAWRDKPITFDLYNRTRKDNIHVSLKFKNVGDNDPDVDYFSYTSYDLVNLYLYKEETSTWSLIIKKESNGNMEIANLTIPNFNRDYLEYHNMNTQISALPSNTTTNPLIQATQRTYGGISGNSITAPAFIKSGGQSSQFLKANGNVGTVVNDLSTGGTENALSAEQGKALNDRLDAMQTVATGTITGFNNKYGASGQVNYIKYNGWVAVNYCNLKLQAITSGTVPPLFTVPYAALKGIGNYYFYTTDNSGYVYPTTNIQKNVPYSGVLMYPTSD